MPLIVLEGLDGAGKSTQVKLLRKMLAEAGRRVEYVHFPRFDAPVYGDMIARFLRGELGEVEQVNPYVVALLFAGDRAHAGPMIKEWLADGRFVLLDRYVNSNIAFQCAKLDDIEERRMLKDWILDTEFTEFGIPKPDMSLFLDVPFEFTEKKLTGDRHGDDRNYLRGARDIHEESLDLQRRVREVYLWRAAEDNTMSVVDCSCADGCMAGPEEIFEKVKEKVEPLITRTAG